MLGLPVASIAFGEAIVLAEDGLGNGEDAPALAFLGRVVMVVVVFVVVRVAVDFDFAYGTASAILTHRYYFSCRDFSFSLAWVYS
jgi:hypothetical protein